MQATLKKRGAFAHVVLTVRHNRSDPIEKLKSVVMDASRKARSGKSWKPIQTRMAAVGILSSPEVTWNPRFGWNFHIHIGVACLTDDEAEIKAACEAMVGRYIAEIKKAGYDAVWPAQFIEISDDAEIAGDYITKGIVWEIAGGTGTKTSAHRDSLTPFQIAANAAAGDAQMRKLWLEYAAAMPGTRACVVTKSMADALELTEKIEPEREGEGELDLEETDDVVDHIPVPIWNRIVKNCLAGTMLGRLETAGVEGWPVIREWVFAKAKQSSRRFVDQIPFDDDSPIPLKPPPLTADEIVAKLARQSRESVGGQKLIQRELTRLEVQHAKFGGLPPPTSADILRALVPNNGARQYCGPLRESSDNSNLGAVARSEIS